MTKYVGVRLVRGGGSLVYGGDTITRTGFLQPNPQQPLLPIGKITTRGDNVLGQHCGTVEITESTPQAMEFIKQANLIATLRRKHNEI